MEAKKPYGKPLFFSKLQMVAVKNEPIAEQKVAETRRKRKE